MDKEKLIALMNEDLASEYRSIVQYVTHIATIKGAQYQSIVNELSNHLSQELSHATILAEQIDFLGGIPTTDVPAVPQAKTASDALQQDLQLEEEQLARYRERFEQATSMMLADVSEAIRPILEQTQDHVRDLRMALER
jgi:bacterioferritin